MPEIIEQGGGEVVDIGPGQRRTVYPGEAEISLAAVILTASGCTNPALAIDDDPATAAMFGPPTLEAFGTASPAISSSAVTYFNGGLPVPAGSYQVSYAGGALNYTGGSAWGINTTVSDGTPNPRGGSPNHAFYLTDGARNLGLTPGTNAFFPTAAACEAANAGLSLVFTYAGGPLGVYLHDSPIGDNSPAPDGGPTFGLAPASPTPAPRFLRADWGYDAFISRIRLAFSGPGAASAGVDYESSLSFAEGENPSADIALSYIPVPADGTIHEVVFNPPVLGRGAVFYPDALLGTPSSQPVSLAQFQVYQDISQSLGVPVMPAPTTNQARVGCSGAVITPRFYTNPTSYPFPQTAASVLRSIQGLNFTEAVKLARETGGETVHQINGYETDREIKCKISVERHDYLALQNFLGGTLIVNPANPGAGLQETQYHAPGYTDRAPYFSLVAQSTNGDPSALFVLPKCKIDGSLTADLERDKVTMLDVDFVCFWDYNYTRQDGTVGGIYEQVFNNGGATALHS